MTESNFRRISREEAKAQGFRRYYDGPCARGHTAERYTVNGQCVECQKIGKDPADAKRQAADLAARTEAKAARTTRYSSSRKCPKDGHGHTRFTANGCCIDCAAGRKATAKTIRQARRIAVASVGGDKLREKDPRIITRKETRAHRLPTFFDGKPCSKGHVSERTTKRGKCLACSAIAERERSAAAEARANGRNAYVSEVTCKRGHVGERYVSNGGCVECNRVGCAARHAANREENRVRARQRYETNKETYAIKRKAYYQTNKETVLARQKVYYLDNFEKIAVRMKVYSEPRKGLKQEYDKEYRSKNKGVLEPKRKAYRKRTSGAKRAYDQRRRIENPGLSREYSNLKRARKRKAPGRHTRADIQRLMLLQKGKCFNCLTSLKKGYHVDHRVALANGGGNGPDNLQLLCPPCNQDKHVKDPIDWARKNGRLL